MRHRAFMIVTVLAASLLAPLSAQQEGGPADRRALLGKLRDDLTTAMANAKLSDEQKKKLDESRDTLRKATERRRKGERVGGRALRATLEDVQTVFQSDAFRPEDRQAVQDDIAKLRQLRRKEGRRRNRQAVRGSQFARAETRY